MPRVRTLWTKQSQRCYCMNNMADIFNKTPLHVGFSANRLHPDADNPREVAFAASWEKVNSPVFGHPTVEYLIPNSTERDAKVAATIIQWLGSNVGMSFLVDVIEEEPKVKEWLRERCQFS